jgi:DNA polymerase I
MRFLLMPTPINVDSDVAFESLMDHLLSLPHGWEGRIALDTETAKGLSITNNHVVVWSMSDGVDRWQLKPEFLWSPKFIQLWTDPGRYWVMANAKFDMHQLYLMGVPEMGGLPIDIISMAFINDENRSERARYGLKEIAADYLKLKMTSFQSTFGKGVDSEALMLGADPDKLLEYSTEDAFITWKLSEEIRPYLDDLPFDDVCRHFKTGFDYLINVEAPFTKTLWRMERRGISVHPQRIAGLSEEYETRTKQQFASMLKAVGRPDFNFNSSKQLGDHFFGTLGLKPLKLTDSGRPALDADVLEKYAERGVGLAKMLVKWRTDSKLLATFIRGYFIDARTRDDRIHCSFKQHGTVTGRLSCESPNLQNIPSDQSFRAVFIPDDGYKLGCYDYGQVELRVLGHFCKDESLCQAFHEGLDLHTFTASRMLGVEYSDVTAARVVSDDKISDHISAIEAECGLDRQSAERLYGKLTGDRAWMKSLLNARKAAKTINFGILYGMSAARLAGQLEVSKEDAQEYLDGWFAAYPRVKDFIYGQVLSANDNEFHEVRSIQGRYRRLPRILSEDMGVKRQNERLAVNSTVQGSAGDIAKMAMLWIDNHPDLGGGRLEGGTYGVELLLQVHDELVMQCPEQYAPIVDPIIRAGLVNPPWIDINVPLIVDGGFANNWGEAK